MRAGLVGSGAIEIGFGGIDILLAVSVSALFIFRPGLGGGGAGFGNFFRAKTAYVFFRGGTRLRERCLELFVVEGDECLTGLDRIPLANKYLVDASANLGADANVASFDGAGTLQGGVVVEPVYGIG